MASRNEFDDFFGDDEETAVTDTRADGRLYRVPLARLAPNLVNPRQDFGTQDDLIDFGKSLQRRQNQPCPVVSRNAYLKLWPEPADRIKDVDYVLVSGERRYRAATVVGLGTLDCVVNDNFARDRKTFMEAVVSENVDRQNFDPVEEAYAVRALVAEFGSNRAVAQHFERADGWVTQRILLTHLAREVQDLVRTKKMPLDAARQLGKLTKDKDWTARDQTAWWEDEQDRRAAASAARTAARKAPRHPAPDPLPAPAPPTGPALKPESFTAVKPENGPEPVQAQAPTTAVPDGRPVSDAVPTPRTDGTTSTRDAAAFLPEAPDSVPEPREVPPTPDTTLSPGQKRFPYEDGTEASRYLIHRMSQAEFDKMLDALLEHRAKQVQAAR